MVVTSIGGKIAFPFYGYYNATKHALEASFESLWYETQKSGVRIKIVEPGFVRTNFVAKGLKTGSTPIPRLNRAFQRLARNIQESPHGSTPEKIAEQLLSIAKGNSNRLRYTSGYLSSLVFLQNLLPESIFHWLISGSTLSDQEIP